MNSCIYTGKVFHERLAPRKNSFRYSVYLMYLDLDELPDLQKDQWMFGLNSWNILSFRDDDHFKFVKPGNDDIDAIAHENLKGVDFGRYIGKSTKERIRMLVKDLDLGFEAEKVFILTNLRVFGYVFNPVSFYFCFDADGVPRAMFSEVNNTFLDQKMYCTPIADQGKGVTDSRQKKNFYISPFISCENMLEWRFTIPGKSFMMMIDSMDGERTDLKTVLTGERREITKWSLLRVQLRYPLMTFRVIFLIHSQALKLFLKKVPFRKKSESDTAIAGMIRNR